MGQTTCDNDFDGWMVMIQPIRWQPPEELEDLNLYKEGYYHG